MMRQSVKDQDKQSIDSLRMQVFMYDLILASLGLFFDTLVMFRQKDKNRSVTSEQQSIERDCRVQDGNLQSIIHSKS
jgi:hypothetical protein